MLPTTDLPASEILLSESLMAPTPPEPLMTAVPTDALPAQVDAQTGADENPDTRTDTAAVTAAVTAADTAGDSKAAAPHDGSAATGAAPAMTPAACALQLKQLFPALFAGMAKPLKLRIQADIQARAPGLFTKQLLSVVLRRYTGSHSYLVALTQATHRFDLDGAPAGELSPEHKQAAIDELLLRRTAQREAHRSQRQTQSDQQKDTQRISQRDEAASRALEQQKRYNRATLLRDFENTTLTPANFSALKGLTVEAMGGYLATAREEALALRVAGQPEFLRETAQQRTDQPTHEQRGARPLPQPRRPHQASRGPRR